MEPRARAGKNVGKMNFSFQELTQFLIAHGDSRQPLPETIRVLDEILTEFIQGVSFEATRIAQLAGRQKVKYEDFQFAMRKNPVFLGKAAENKELREIIEKQKKAFDETEYIKADDGDGAAGAATGGGPGRVRKRAAPKDGDGGTRANDGGRGVNGAAGDDDDGLGEDDMDADGDILEQLVGSGSRKA